MESSEAYQLVVGDSLYSIPHCLVVRDYGESYPISSLMLEKMVSASLHREFSALSVIRRWRPHCAGRRLVVIGLPPNHQSRATRWVWCIRLHLEMSEATEPTVKLLSQHLGRLVWPLQTAEAATMWSDFVQHSVMSTSSLVVNYTPSKLAVSWCDEESCERVASFPADQRVPLQCLLRAFSLCLLKAGPGTLNSAVRRVERKRKRSSHGILPVGVFASLPGDIMHTIAGFCINDQTVVRTRRQVCQQWTAIREASVGLMRVADNLGVDFVRHGIRLGRAVAFGQRVDDALALRDHVLPSGVNPLCLLSELFLGTSTSILDATYLHDDQLMLLTYMRLLGGKSDTAFPPPSPYVRMCSYHVFNARDHGTRSHSQRRVPSRLRLSMRVPRECVQERITSGWSLVLYTPK